MKRDHRAAARVEIPPPERREGSPAPTPKAAPVLPWENERVREILGPATYAQPHTGGLIFAMDATASRGPTWRIATQVQGEMFSSFTPGLKIQLVYYRGDAFHASPWTRNAKQLADVMRGVVCAPGQTQIGKVLAHAARGRVEVAALVFVGDCMEERAADLNGLAHKLEARRIKAFMFQEGGDPRAAAAFKDIAGITHGAYCRFGHQSARELKDLLAGAAAYAAGGTPRLAQLARSRPAALRLLAQLK